MVTAKMLDAISGQVTATVDVSTWVTQLEADVKAGIRTQADADAQLKRILLEGALGDIREALAALATDAQQQRDALEARLTELSAKAADFDPTVKIEPK